MVCMQVLPSPVLKLASRKSKVQDATSPGISSAGLSTIKIDPLHAKVVAESYKMALEQQKMHARFKVFPMLNLKRILPRRFPFELVLLGSPWNIFILFAS